MIIKLATVINSEVIGMPLVEEKFPPSSGHMVINDVGRHQSEPRGYLQLNILSPAVGDPVGHSMDIKELDK